MKFSVWPDMSHAPDEVLATARWADRNGLHGIWYADHYMPNTGTREIARGPMHECWTMLPAIAAVTERIRIGSLVTPTSVHHPAVLANRATTLDHLSNGRAVLGIGAGWQINEHHAYGIELERPARRVTRFSEAIQIIRLLFNEELTHFDGTVYCIRGAPMDPKPVQSPLPILVGTGSPRMLRITARFADQWNTWGGPPMAQERRQKFEAACESVGRDAATMWTSAQAQIIHTDDADEAARVRDGDMGSRSIVGGVAEIVNQLGWYGEHGFDEFIVPDWNLGNTPEARRESLEHLHADVLSQLT